MVSPQHCQSIPRSSIPQGWLCQVVPSPCQTAPKGWIYPLALHLASPPQPRGPAATPQPSLAGSPPNMRSPRGKAAIYDMLQKNPFKINDSPEPAECGWEKGGSSCRAPCGGSTAVAGVARNRRQDPILTQRRGHSQTPETTLNPALVPATPHRPQQLQDSSILLGPVQPIPGGSPSIPARGGAGAGPAAEQPRAEPTRSLKRKGLAPAANPAAGGPGMLAGTPGIPRHRRGRQRRGTRRGRALLGRCISKLPAPAQPSAPPSGGECSRLEPLGMRLRMGKPVKRGI